MELLIGENVTEYRTQDTVTNSTDNRYQNTSRKRAGNALPCHTEVMSDILEQQLRLRECENTHLNFRVRLKRIDNRNEQRDHREDYANGNPSHNKDLRV